MGRDNWKVQRTRHTPWGAVALVLLTGIALMRNGVDVPDGPPQPVAAARLDAPRDLGDTGDIGDTEEAGDDRLADEPVRMLPYAPAARVSVPAIKVDAPIVDVGLDQDGWIAAPPPQDPNLAGWYQNGISPGQRGTAVLVGHVDNLSGPAVFYGLGALTKGEHVEVTRYDGRVAVFEIYGVEVFSKADFPGPRVYGDTGYAELRVITCGGGYSKAGGYDGNVVVFARLTETR
ncbi:class F sortase [Streptomyces sp. AM 2-1-1]|uniref:class F sortase n=1 Tax=Streptomyces sp. AM 2-1-1 TaxID=3028709 RepID=UPI0023B900CC|nr:class F sortase [Streptomyces sp. AM 2-1-1]WEH43540.1 class F sortase [Streptomyces sp. AM 2-1-1]